MTGPRHLSALVAAVVLLASPSVALGELIDHSAPSVVILPPKLPLHATSQTRIAAELLCDRLAQEITAAGLAQVVDRSQLEHVLKEKELSAGPITSIVSYDAMVRVEVDSDGLVPRTHVKLIDLSTGNILGDKSFGWPVREADIQPIATLLCSSLKSAGEHGKSKLKVRTLGMEDVGIDVRMQPLGVRLVKMFDEALSRSDRVLLVSHLEAGTSKEESLLLLMGLSRLPGGRHFVPQADATIELRVKEKDSIGKSFEQTTVEIGVRLRKGADYQGDWVGTGGKVAEFDQLITQAWEKLSESLSEVRSDAATKRLGEMVLRRKQAEAELKAAENVKLDPRTEKKILERLAHIEAAIKIDASYETASYALVLTLNRLYEHLASQPLDKKDEAYIERTRRRLMLEIVRYIQRFDSSPMHRAGVVLCAYEAIVRTPLIYLWKGKTSSNIALTLDLQRDLDALKQLVDRSVAGDIHGYSRSVTGRLVCIVYRGMRLAGVPLSRRQQWVDLILDNCDRQAKQIHKIKHGSESILESYDRLRVSVAGLAVEDGQFDRARKLLAQVRSRVDSREFVGRENQWLVRLMRDVTVKLDDAEAVSEFNRWAERLLKPVHLISVKWPSVEVFHDRKRVGADMTQVTMPPVKSTPIRYKVLPNGGFNTATSALAEGDRCLCVVIAATGAVNWWYFSGDGSSSRSQLIGVLPLDAHGKPVGKTYHVKGAVFSELWDTLKLLPQPEVRQGLHVLCVRYLGGKLYLGTLRSGLLVFDPKTQKWTIYTPEQGLPDWAVYTVYPLDEHTLFCTGQSSHRVNSYYTLDLQSGRVTLLHRTDTAKQQWFDKRPRHFWRNGEKLMGWCNVGLCEDLLDPGVKFRRVHRSAAYGWQYADHCPIVSMVEIDDRLFFTSKEGLYEFDRTGKIIRNWWKRHSLRPTIRSTDIVIPPDCPIQGQHMVKAGSMLVFAADDCLTGYNPKTDTWYGPLRVSNASHALGTPTGIWVGTRDGLLYVNVDEFLATAEKAGRVMTTEQYRQRRQRLIDAMPPLEKAKVYLAMRQFDTAENLLTEVLRDDPKNAEALLVMGCIHDVWCNNQPQQALEYYRRMAELKENPNASFTGMYHSCGLLASQKRWTEVYDLSGRILEEFPRIHKFYHEKIQWWRKNSRKYLHAPSKHGG